MMKRSFPDLLFNGVVLQSIKRLPEETRAVRFVMALMEEAGLSSNGHHMEPNEMVECLKRTWRRNKTRVKPTANKVRVETFVKKGDDFELVILLIRFQKRSSQSRVVGVCGTPKGFLWRARKLRDVKQAE